MLQKSEIKADRDGIVIFSQKHHRGERWPETLTSDKMDHLRLDESIYDIECGVVVHLACAAGLQ